VSDRQESAGAVPAALLDALVASAPDALYVVGHAGDIRFANPAALVVLGYESEAALLGRPSHATIHHMRPDGSPFAAEECPLLRTPLSGETVRVDEDWFVRSDGSLVAVAYASAPLELPDGRGAIVSFRDVGEQLRARQALAERLAEQARLEELEASRKRLVEVADQERRRLARDLHDGAQQELVHAVVSLQLARRRLDRDHAAAFAALDEGLAAVRSAIRDVRDLAQGIHPAVLSARGLSAAVEQLTARLSVAVTIDVLDDRLAAPVETAAYFVISECLTNVAKHARAASVAISARSSDGWLAVEVSDDGVGGAVPNGGSGLRGLADRVGAAGGTLEIDSPPGAGTRLRARIPLSGRDR